MQHNYKLASEWPISQMTKWLLCDDHNYYGMAGRFGSAVHPLSRFVGHERFLANVTTRHATVRLFFRQRFHGHVDGYDIFYMMCQVLELSRDGIFIETELTR